MRVITHPRDLASIAGSSRRADEEPGADALILAGRWPARTVLPRFDGIVLRTMREGVEDCFIGGRRAVVDPDTYLVADGRTGVSRAFYRGDGDVRAVVVCLPRAWFESADGPRAPAFMPTLRRSDDATGRLLVALGDIATQRTDDAAPLVDAGRALVELIADANEELQREAERIASIKASTRYELHRRVRLASDFILSHYDQSITLVDIAAAASLSRFHLVRLFQQALGTTPHALLQEKRLAAARRLIGMQRWDMGEIAERSGFRTRSSLWRAMRRSTDDRGHASDEALAPAPAASRRMRHANSPGAAPTRAAPVASPTNPPMTPTRSTDAWPTPA